VLVVASVVFHALIWTQLRYVLANVGISEHMLRLRTEVRRLLTLLPSSGEQQVARVMDEALTGVLSWEERGNKRGYGSKWLLPIELARYLIPLLAALGCGVAYGLTPHVDLKLGWGSLAWLTLDALVVVGELVLGAYTVWACLRVRAGALAILREVPLPCDTGSRP
jgi:hypothetical protein